MLIQMVLSFSASLGSQEREAALKGDNEFFAERHAREWKVRGRCASINLKLEAVYMGLEQK